jgi:hypothetical protein
MKLLIDTNVAALETKTIQADRAETIGEIDDAAKPDETDSADKADDNKTN